MVSGAGLIGAGGGEATLLTAVVVVGTRLTGDGAAVVVEATMTVLLLLLLTTTGGSLGGYSAPRIMRLPNMSITVPDTSPSSSNVHRLSRNSGYTWINFSKTVGKLWISRVRIPKGKKLCMIRVGILKQGKYLYFK